jgi:plastocyanin
MKKTIRIFLLLLPFTYLSMMVESSATKWIINVQNFSFVPSNLTNVILGDTIRWVWISGMHTTTNLIIPPGAIEWDENIDMSNPSFEYVPAVTGIYNYKCTPHFPSMVASFQVSDPTSVSFNLKVFLEGAFNGTNMDTGLNSSGLIPLNQPYNTLPWNYPGTENVSSMPNTDVVDWILFELRETTGSASTATADKVIHRQAAFLLKSGTVTGLDGSSMPEFTGTINNNIYGIIYHRNHIGIMSASALFAINGIYTYNFTLSAGQVHGGSSGYKNL